jgi:fructokinase
MEGEGPVVAGVELGGTKALAVLVRGREILERVRVPTTEPAATLSALSEGLLGWQRDGRSFAAIGIASFGPVGLDRSRHDYGWVTSTPKPGWHDVDVLGHFSGRFDVPIGFDTDVAGAALAELRWGAAQGCAVVVYLTIGTGIGGGVVVDGRPLHGLVHPEVGHVRVRRRPGDPFAGVCPYHGDCVEGLVSGPAIAARAGAPAQELGPEHPVWDDVAPELADLLASLVLVVSPHRIVIGGGVGHGRPFLLDRVRPALVAALNGYVAALDAAAVDGLVRPPALGDGAGPLGAAALALDALQDLR